MGRVVYAYFQANHRVVASNSQDFAKLAIELTRLANIHLIRFEELKEKRFNSYNVVVLMNKLYNSYLYFAYCLHALIKPMLISLLFAPLLPVSANELGFRGIPYRPDGVKSEAGYYTTFSDQSVVFNTQGLNCSGLVLEITRKLLNKDIPVSLAIYDRTGYPENGKDWAFGWNLIMNLSEGMSRRFLLPNGVVFDPERASAFYPLGYNIADNATWDELPNRLTRGHFYLIDFNVNGRKKGYGLIHYHVGIIHIGKNGEAWLYQTTSNSKVSNRRNLRTEEGQRSFKRDFADTGGQKRRILILEVDF